MSAVHFTVFPNFCFCFLLITYNLFIKFENNENFDNNDHSEKAQFILHQNCVAIVMILN